METLPNPTFPMNSKSTYLVIDQVTGSIANLKDQVVVNADRLTEKDLSDLESDSGAIEVAKKYGYTIDPFRIELVTPQEILDRYRQNQYKINQEDEDVTMLDLLSLFSVLIEMHEEHWVQGQPNDVY